MQKMQVFFVLFQKIMKDLLLGPTHQIGVPGCLHCEAKGPSSCRRWTFAQRHLE